MGVAQGRQEVLDPGFLEDLLDEDSWVGHGARVGLDGDRGKFSPGERGYQREPLGGSTLNSSPFQSWRAITGWP